MECHSGVPRLTRDDRISVFKYRDPIDLRLRSGLQGDKLIINYQFMKKYQTIGMVLAAIVLGYFLGMSFPIKNQNAVSRESKINMMGNMTPRAGAMGGSRPISGEIIAVDDKSITIKLQNDTSKIILFDSGIIINKMAKGAITDLKVGEKVAAFGSENTDGSMTAQNVQLNPQFQMNKTGLAK